MRVSLIKKTLIMVVVVVVAVACYLNLQTHATVSLGNHLHHQLQESMKEMKEGRKKEESLLERGEEGGRRGEEGREGRGGGGYEEREREELRRRERMKIAARESWVKEMETHSLPPVDLEKIREDVERRRGRVDEMCEYGDDFVLQELNSSEFIISDKYKLIWCNIFKSASSTWIYNFLRMAGNTPEQLEHLHRSPVDAVRALYPRPSLGELRNALENKREGYLSFVIVREPFQRLLSAYRDKIETIHPYYTPLRCTIVKQYPDHSKSSWFEGENKDCKPSFSQFVSYVLGEEEKGATHNEHWAPYYRFCTPCAAKFDLILKFERLGVEEAYLVSKVPQLSTIIQSKVIHSSHTNYTRETKRYYRELTPIQLIGLLKLYLPDFRLFGYSEKPYLDYVT